MLWTCCTQYVSKFGKLSSGHRTGRGQFSFQFQRTAMPKNVQTTIQSCSFHMLVRLCLKSFKLGFNSMSTENFHMCKLGLGMAEEPEIKLPPFVGSWRKQGNSRKNIYFCFIDHIKAFMWITSNWKILTEMGIPDYLTCLLRNLHIKKQQLELDMEHQTGSELGKKYLKVVFCHPDYLICVQSTSWEMLDWMKNKLESRFLGEITITSDMQMMLP